MGYGLQSPLKLISLKKIELWNCVSSIVNILLNIMNKSRLFIVKFEDTDVLTELKAYQIENEIEKNERWLLYWKFFYFILPDHSSLKCAIVLSRLSPRALQDSGFSCLASNFLPLCFLHFHRLLLDIFYNRECWI